MSNISAVTSAASKYVSQTASSSSGASALQEASETPDVTAKEAAKGDQVAKRLLLKEQQAKAAEQGTPSSSDSESASEPGKGETIDQKA